MKIKKALKDIVNSVSTLALAANTALFVGKDLDLKDYTKAIGYGEKIENLLNANEFLLRNGQVDEYEYERFMNNNYELGKLFLERDEFLRSKVYFETAEMYAEKIRDFDVEARCYYHIALIEREKGNREEALINLSGAILKKEKKDPTIKIGDLNYLRVERLNYTYNYLNELKEMYKLLGDWVKEDDSLLNYYGININCYDFYGGAIKIEDEMDSLKHWVDLNNLINKNKNQSKFKNEK